jgi:CheY-like chemotaxis protein
MGGVHAAEGLRADDRTSHIPMIAISGQDFTLAEEAELNTLFDERFRKPFSPLAVLNAVHTSIGPPGGMGHVGLPV